jgi:hypothetical protein
MRPLFLPNWVARRRQFYDSLDQTSQEGQSARGLLSRGIGHAPKNVGNDLAPRGVFPSWTSRNGGSRRTGYAVSRIRC